METFVVLVHYGGEWVQNERGVEYVNIQGSKMVKIRGNSDLCMLLNRLCNRIGIDRRRSDITLATLASGVACDLYASRPIYIEDDEDVEALIDNLRKSPTTNFPLYITETPRSNTGRGNAAQVLANPVIQHQNAPTFQAPCDDDNAEDEDVYKPDENVEEPDEDVGVPLQFDGVTDEDVGVRWGSSYVYEPPSKTKGWPGLDDLGEGDEWLEEDIGSDDVYAEEMGYSSEADLSLDNEELAHHDPPSVPVSRSHPISADPIQEVGPNIPDPFHWLPAPLPDPVHVVTEGRSGGVGRLSVGEIFKDKQTLQTALGIDAIQKGYQFKVTRSTTERFETKCLLPLCKWKSRSIKVQGTEAFVIRRIETEHTCTRDQINPNHRQAGQRVLGEILKESFMTADRIYRGKEIQADMAQRFRIDVSYAQAWRAKNWALNALQGSPEESFQLLPLYCYNLKEKNPGTVTHIETDGYNRFQYFFMAMGCSLRAFKEHVRPVICVDAAHLKGRFSGMMFLAVAMDGNNQIYPVAIGMGDSENNDSWSWFMYKLRECIGDVPNLAIISDCAPSIINVVRMVFPQAVHGSCCQHLRMNFRCKYGKSEHTEALFWKAAKAYRISDFTEIMGIIQSLNPMVALYLEQAGYDKWARSHFNGRRYNIMTTNCAESVNALTRHARRLPITMLVEYFRSTLQSWFYERRNVAAEWGHPLTPWATAKVAKRVTKMATWTVFPVTRQIYQVKDGMKDGLVDIQQRTCTCGKYQLTQLPCSHAAAVARDLRLSNCSHWAQSYYSTETLQRLYMEPIFPVGPQAEWVQPYELQVVLPPVNSGRRRAGRPRGVSRIPSRGEEPQRPLCSRCNTRGHTRLNCMSEAPMDRSAASSSNANRRSGRARMPPSG